MEKTKREITFTSEYKKGLKLAKKQGKDMDALKQVIKDLANDVPLSKDKHDHQLSGSEKKFRECHIQPDWLLKYYKAKDKLILVLVSLGSHSRMFGK